MEQLAIFREPSHEPSAAPDDGLEKAGRKKRMPKREFGIEREAAAMKVESQAHTQLTRQPKSRKSNASPFALPGQNRSASSPGPSSSRKLRTSVYSSDPKFKDSPSKQERGQQSVAAPSSSLSRGPAGRNEHRRQIEELCHLECPDDDDEVPETLEDPKFPIAQSAHDAGRRRSTMTTGVSSVPRGRRSAAGTSRLTNSSPIRKMDTKVVLSSDEEPEPIENPDERHDTPKKEPPSRAGLLSPDVEPPKRLPRTDHATRASLKSRMKKKDGSSVEDKHAISFFGGKAASIPSSNLHRRFLAQLEWAFAEDDDEEAGVRVRVESIALQDNELQLYGGSESATIGLKSMRSITTDLAAFMRLKFSLNSREQAALEKLSSNLSSGKVEITLALRAGEEGSEKLVNQVAKFAEAKSLPFACVEKGVADTFKRQYDRLSASNSRKQARRPPPASKAAEAAEKRAKDAQKGKGKETVNPSQSLLSFEAAQPPRRSARHSTAAAMPTVNTLSDDEPSTSRPQRRRSPHLDKHDLLFPYPFTGRSSLDITKDSLYRLMDDDFLNDVTLEFGLRFTVAEASQKQEKALHLFNSFFYNKLSSRDSKPKPDDAKNWPAYDSVKKWTKSVDVFQKDFIIVPVNENLHWYLAVIFNPRALLDQRPPSTERQSTPREASAKPSRSTSASAESSRKDKDPLDVMSEDESVEHIKGKVEDCHISPPPKPIQSMELNWIHSQDDLTFSAPPKSPSPVKSKPKFKREAIDLFDSSKTYIMTFDSLGGSHKAVGDNLKLWLEFEARDKLQQEIAPSAIQYVEAKVPQQNNFSDCGVFVIHFLWCLLNDSDQVLKFIGKAIPYAREKEEKEEYESEMNRVWHAATTKELRANWIQVIQQLNLQYQETKGQGESQAAASLPGIEGSQASVVQVYPSDRPDPLPTVDEAVAAPATDSTSSGGASTSSASSSSAAPPDPVRPLDTGRQLSEARSRAVSRDAPAESQPQQPNLQTPTLPHQTILSDSESESGLSREPSRMRSTSSKVSSRQEVDERVLVEDSQPKSDDESGSPSILFPSDQPEGDASGTVVPDTLDAGVLSEDEDEIAGPIDLSGDHAPSAVPRAAQLSSAKSKWDSSQFGSSPPREPPSSPTRQPKKKMRSSRKSGPDGYKQQTLFEYRVPNSGPSSSAQGGSAPPPEAREADVSEAPPPRNHNTYKGKKRAVSGASGPSERKRARSNTASADQGNSKQNPIDLDPSDDE